MVLSVIDRQFSLVKATDCAKRVVKQKHKLNVVNVIGLTAESMARRLTISDISISI